MKIPNRKKNARLKLFHGKPMRHTDQRKRKANWKAFSLVDGAGKRWMNNLCYQ